MRRAGDHLAHDVADFGQLVHQVDLVVQTARRVDQHHVGAVGLGRGQRVERHRCRVRTHLLTDHRGSRTVGPDLELVDGGGAERVGGADPDLLSGFGELGREFADGRGLSGAVDAHDHHHVRFALFGVESEMLFGAVRLLHQRGYLFAQNGLQLGGAHILVARHALFDAPDDFDGGFHAYVRRDQHLFQVVQYVGIDRRTACNGAGELREKSRLGLFQPGVKLFLLLFALFGSLRGGVVLLLFENIEKCHV